MTKGIETTDVAATPTTMQSDQSIKLPRSIQFMGFVYGLFSNRVATCFLSLILVIASYLLDCYRGVPMFLVGSGTLVAGLGVILTIKHNYLNNINSAVELVKKYDNVFTLPNTSWNSIQNQQKAISKAADEGIGVTLVLLGALVTFLSPLVPLVSLCSHK